MNSHDITFRPHHFLCTLCFRGNGYSPNFVQNYKDIVNTLSDETPINITPHTDSICAPCPHKRSLNCTNQNKIALLDKQHTQALKLEDPVITWGDAKKSIRQNITLEKFHAMCAPCEWKKLGICEKVLIDFLVDKEV